MIYCTFAFGTLFALFQNDNLVGTNIYERHKNVSVSFHLASRTVNLTDKGRNVMFTMDCQWIEKQESSHTEF